MRTYYFGILLFIPFLLMACDKAAPTTPKVSESASDDIATVRSMRNFVPFTSDDILREYAGLVYANPNALNGSESFIIQDTNAYDQFITRIYPYAVSSDTNPPPSKDPLLQKPKVDFARERLVVVINDRDGMFGNVTLVEIKEYSEAYKIIFARPIMSDAYQQIKQIEGLGTYKAWVVKKPSSQIKFQEVILR